MTMKIHAITMHFVIIMKFVPLLDKSRIFAFCLCFFKFGRFLTLNTGNMLFTYDDIIEAELDEGHLGSLGSFHIELRHDMVGLYPVDTKGNLKVMQLH